MKVGDTLHYTWPPLPAEPKGEYECKLLGSHGSWVWIRPINWRSISVSVATKHQAYGEWKPTIHITPLTAFRKDVLLKESKK